MNSYLILKVSGKNIPKFILRCKNNNINILKIEQISYKEALIKINYKDYDKLLKIKSIYDITLINNTGFLKFKELLNKHKYFLIMFTFGILFLIYLCNIIFEVDVISTNNELNNLIKRDLENYNIKKYKLKKSYKEKERIKSELLEKYNDTIEWIEITDVGTKYEVQVVERKKKVTEEKDEYTNIVASKSGVLRKIYAEEGVKVVDNNTYVNKGDIIISGAITKDEEIKKIVNAKGKVYAEVWYNVNIEFPLEYTEKKYTNEKKKSVYMRLGNKYISKRRFKNFERRKILSLKNRLVPFELGIEEEQKVNIINDKYTIEEAKKKAILSAKEKILQSLDKDEYITSQKTLKFYAKDSKIVLDIFFSCYEQIGKEEKIIPEE